MIEEPLGLGRRVAKGAAWMVVLRWSVRAIGLVSTLVLLRLLAPTDFGLVALGVFLMGLLEVFGSFGFETIIIQKQTAERSYYDTGWTLNLLKATVMAVLLAVLAYPVSAFYAQPRLAPVVLVFAASSLVGGLENIGTVDFQKNLDFRSYFVLLVSKKIFAFLVTLSAAFLLRDYWALVIGIASSTAFGVLLSYIFSPYRPRLGLGKAREMFHFSKWLMANEVLSYLSLQADAGIVGKFVSTHVLGYYEIAKEVAALPNTELVWPIAKALFPGYAMVKDDVPRMRAMFLRSLSLAFALAQPMTVGIALDAKELVPLLMGERWLEAIPLIQLFAVIGCFSGGWLGMSSMLIALGKPSVTTYVQTALNIPKLAFVTIGVLHNGAIGAAYGVLAAAVINYLSGYYLVWRFIGVSWREAFAVKWRVAVALAAMALAVEAASLLAGAQGDLTLLVVKTLVGALTYAGCLLSLWVACGRPAGGEQIILREIAARLPWLRKPAT